MKHYLFEDWEGEQFIVSADNLKKAKARAAEYFGENCRHIGRLSDYEAECSGLDEY